MAGANCLRVRGALLALLATPALGMARAPLAWPRAIARSAVRLSSSEERRSVEIDAASLRDLSSWDDEEEDVSLKGVDSYMTSLKTGGTPERERDLAPPAGWVPFSNRGDVVVGDVESDAYERYMMTLRRDSSVDPDAPVVLRGDQAIDSWLGSLKTGGTPESERNMVPPDGYIPSMDRLAMSMGVRGEEIYAKAEREGDAHDIWMDSLRTGGTPENERDMEAPEGYMPYVDPDAVADTRMSKRVASPKAAAAPARQPVAAPVVQAAVAPPPVRVPVREPVYAAPAPVTRPPQQQQQAQQQRVPAMAVMCAASPSVDVKAVDEAVAGLITWLAQPAESRRGEAGASLRASIAAVEIILAASTEGRALVDLRSVAATLPLAPPLARGAQVATPPRAAAVLQPAAPPAAQPAAPRSQQQQMAVPPQAPRTQPMSVAAPRAGRVEYDFDKEYYDPEDVEPERQAFEGRSVTELIPGSTGNGQARNAEKNPGAVLPPTSVSSLRSPAARPTGPNSGLISYMASLPGANDALPSGREELRGFSSQYKIDGMEDMTMLEYRAAMDAKVSKTVKDWRKRGTVGSEVSQNYMDSLNKKSE